MTDEIYYLISLGIVGILGIATNIKPVILALLYYPITKFILTYFRTSVNENVNTDTLDDFYLFFSRIIKNIGKVVTLIIDWIIKPPLDLIIWIVGNFKKVFIFIKDAFIFFIVKVPKYVLYVLSKLINIFIIQPLKLISDYFQKIIDWFISEKGLKYIMEWIVNVNRIYYFQYQELLNFFIRIFKGKIPIPIFDSIPEVKVIDIDNSYFVLNKIASIIK
jgi:hypothetical protein